MYALTALHNFILQHTDSDEHDIGLDLPNRALETEERINTSITEEVMDIRRDHIATAM